MRCDFRLFDASLRRVVCFILLLRITASENSFTIENDMFVKDGTPVRLFSGSMHYHRIHPAQWKDRMRRIKALGLNSIQTLVPWSFHEARSGEYKFEGASDLPCYLKLAHEHGLMVLLRPGPYICGEWDWGGIPAWLSTSRMTGGTEMQIRSDHPAFLFHVQKWWRVLFSVVKPYLYVNGGPIVLVQMENEYGYCGPKYGLERTRNYMRQLTALARKGLGNDVVLYTTDPPNLVEQGSLPGDEIYTVVDFGANWGHPDTPFMSQKAFNAPGKSPPFNSEFYTGWLTHWTEQVANTSMEALTTMFTEILEYANATASFNLYMAHGGTNFGFTAGANVAGVQYQPHITSYDYDAPISESGDYGQPGLGGTDKYMVIREMLQKYIPSPLPPLEPAPHVIAYGDVPFTHHALLLSSLEILSGGSGIAVDKPEVMEEYGQRWGIIVYRTTLPATALQYNTILDFGSPVHDYAQVVLDGSVVGSSDRSNPSPVILPPMGAANMTDHRVTLDIIVEAMGHENFGCEGWDHKGLTSQDVKHDGTVLTDWLVFPMELSNAASVSWEQGTPHTARHDQQYTSVEATKGPVLYRGTLTIAAGTLKLKNNDGHLPDTFLSTPGWTKGVAWVNGFNLGWYWPKVGPQQTLYVPGAVLHEGVNEVVVLEVEGSPPTASVSMVDTPLYYTPVQPSAMPIDRHEYYMMLMKQATQKVSST